MIARWGRYIAGSYPPLMSILLAVAWAYGVSGLYAVLDPAGGAWHPGWDTAIAALTLAMDLLLMRVIDDIRDLDYDRIHDPKRPLARGVVRISDLFWLYAIVSIAIVALNWRHAGLTIIVAQLLYALAVLFVHERLRWPSGDRLLLSLLISCPGQILVHAYLYAGYLHVVGHPPDRYGLLALGVVFFAALHLEMAKKIVRTPRPGERTYVTLFGVQGTVAVAMAAALISSALLIAGVSSRWPAMAVAMLMLPLILPLLALWRFNTPEPRWRARYAGYYLLLSFATYAIGGGWLAAQGAQ